MKTEIRHRKTSKGFKYTEHLYVLICTTCQNEYTVKKTNYERNKNKNECWGCKRVSKFSKQWGNPTWNSWMAMRQRCRNPNHTGWQYYGGRGIKICESWLNSYDEFLKDMGERPQGFSLDRIDHNGNYEPKNCRWADSTIQAINRRSTTINCQDLRFILDFYLGSEASQEILSLVMDLRN
jgi:hypothetical protein